MTSLSKCILNGVPDWSTIFVSLSCFGFGSALVGRVAGIYKNRCYRKRSIFVYRIYERISNVYERNLAKKLDILWTSKEKGYRFHHTKLDSTSVITKVKRIIALTLNCHFTTSGAYRRTYDQWIWYIGRLYKKAPLTGSIAHLNSKVPTAVLASKGVKLK